MGRKFFPAGISHEKMDELSDLPDGYQILGVYTLPVTGTVWAIIKRSKFNEITEESINELTEKSTPSVSE